jgi:hypothetical protein
MRRSMSIAATLAVMISLSACTTRNTAMDNRDNRTNYGTGYQTRNVGMDNAGYQSRNVGMNNGNNGGNYGGTNIGRTSSNMINAGTFRDGVYTGLSDNTGYGFESAIVTISNGEITNIELNSVNQHEAAKDENTMATGNSGATGGRVIFSLDGRQIGTSTGLNNTNATGTRTGNNTTPKQTTVNPSWNEFDRAKATVINTVIQTQNPNVAVTNTDINLRGKVDSWREAIGRAVNLARR